MRWESAGGSALTCCAATATALSPVNGGWPVSIVMSRQPTPYRSLAGPARRPVACSGDMYAALPITACVAVNAAPRPDSCAMPKSTTVAWLPFTITLAGFTSRWTSPWR